MAAAHPFSEIRRFVRKILVNASVVQKGKFIEEADIEPRLLREYGLIARRCRNDKNFFHTPYPFEQGAGVGVVTGGFFKHRK